MRKTSFLRELLGEELYDKLASYVMPWVPLYTGVWIIMFVLSKFCYWEFFSEVFALLSGFSLLSLAYLTMLVVAFDVQVCVEEEKELCENRKYKRTKFYGIFLILCALLLAFWSNSYRKDYSFKCSTVYVEGGKYHVTDECESIEGSVTEMKGYEAEEEGDEICDACRDWLDDVSEAETESLARHP